MKRFGVQLLPELLEHLNPLQRWESLEIEAALADAFRDARVGGSKADIDAPSAAPHHDLNERTLLRRGDVRVNGRLWILAAAPS